MNPSVLDAVAKLKRELACDELRVLLAWTSVEGEFVGRAFSIRGGKFFSSGVIFKGDTLVIAEESAAIKRAVTEFLPPDQFAQTLQPPIKPVAEAPPIVPAVVVPRPVEAAAEKPSGCTVAIVAFIVLAIIGFILPKSAGAKMREAEDIAEAMIQSSMYSPRSYEHVVTVVSWSNKPSRVAVMAIQWDGSNPYGVMVRQMNYFVVYLNDELVVTPVTENAAESVAEQWMSLSDFD